VKNHQFISIVAAICISLLLSASILAQNSDNGNLSGTVRDTGNAVVAGVKVKAVNLERNFTRETVTDDSGRWTIAILPVGRYEITFEAPSFSTLKRVAQLQTGTTIIDVQLKVGDITLALEVTAENAPLPHP
jgi:Carboxypeptidase regulatory-like domain